MIKINPQPEPFSPITIPKRDETLNSWLARKIHTLLLRSWYPQLQSNDRDFGVVFGRTKGE